MTITEERAVREGKAYNVVRTLEVIFGYQDWACGVKGVPDDYLHCAVDMASAQDATVGQECSCLVGFKGVEGCVDESCHSHTMPDERRRGKLTVAASGTPDRCDETGGDK